MIPAYASAKTAIIGLTRSLAVAYAEDEIRVNAIAPGWINTEISKGGREEPAFNAKVMDRLPIKRWAEPEELAGTAVFLASRDAAQHKLRDQAVVAFFEVAAVRHRAQDIGVLFYYLELFQ
jgi:NAD(P)-dependent dehydrogenase (short-subunit alcohol dehydrogenase family)